MDFSEFYYTFWRFLGQIEKNYYKNYYIFREIILEKWKKLYYILLYCYYNLNYYNVLQNKNFN